MGSLKSFDYWHRVVSYLFLYVFVSVIMMLLFQIAIIIKYGNFHSIELNSFIQALLGGVRGSLKLFTIFIIPFFFLGIIFWLLPWQKPVLLLARFLPYIGLLSFVVSFIISFINFFYYRPFQGKIDAFIFEAQNENFGDLYQYLNGEFSLPLLIFLLIFGIIALFCIHKLLLRWNPPQLHLRRWYSKMIYTLAVFFLIFISARSSLNPHTIYSFIRDAEITDNNLLNSSVTNGIIALYVAYKDHKNLSTLTEIKTKEATESFKTLYPNIEVSQSSLKEKIYKKTENTVFSQNPHTIFVLMEGWGRHLLKFHDNEQFNLLGSLDSHTKEDFFFKNFLSITQGTHASMQFLLANFLGLDITASKYHKTSLDSSIPNVFKKQGYKTIFVTSGKKDWHKMGNLLVSLGFDEILGWNDFKKIYPDAESNFYGGYEETVYDYILQRIKKTSKPLFVFFLTTTNHVPYVFPSNYQPYPLKKTPKSMQKILLSHKKRQQIFTTYQYTSETFGKFISEVKQDSLLKNNVVIAGTGDHNTRDMFNYNVYEENIFYKFAVPFYLYLPKLYKKNVTFDKQRIGSHRDIFPTIFSNIFPNAKYLASGNNLLSKTDKKDFAFNSAFVMSTEGAVLLQQNPVYYQWINQPAGKMKRVQSDTRGSAEENPLLEIYQKQQAFQKLLNWHFLQSIDDTKK